MAHSIICPNANCGYKGVPKKVMRFWRMMLIVPPFGLLALLAYLGGVFSPLLVGLSRSLLIFSERRLL